MKQLSKIQAVELIKGLDSGSIFSVTFTKKNGEKRIMNSIKGTSKGINGEGKKYNDEEKGLISVFDLQLRKSGVEESKCWRTISISTIFEVKAGKEIFEVI